MQLQTKEGLSNSRHTNQGLRLECRLSPPVFNTHTYYICVITLISNLTRFGFLSQKILTMVFKVERACFRRCRTRALFAFGGEECRHYIDRCFISSVLYEMHVSSPMCSNSSSPSSSKRCKTDRAIARRFCLCISVKLFVTHLAEN